MLDWRNAMETSDYHRDALLLEAEHDRVAMEADRGREDRPKARPSVIGLLAVAMVALVASGVIAPR